MHGPAHPIYYILYVQTIRLASHTSNRFIFGERPDPAPKATHSKGPRNHTSVDYSIRHDQNRQTLARIWGSKSSPRRDPRTVSESSRGSKRQAVTWVSVRQCVYRLCILCGRCKAWGSVREVLHTQTLMKCGVRLHCDGDKGMGGAWGLYVALGRGGAMGST